MAISPSENILISHAGLYPEWSFNKALKMSAKVQKALNKPDPKKFLKDMYGNQPNKWNKGLNDLEKLRFSVNAFTRMRYLNKTMGLDFDKKCHPSSAPKTVVPWFNVKNPHLNKHQTVLFGHWASLLGDIPASLPNPAKLIALDTGFVWGNTLSMYCLETKKIIQIQA